MDRNAKFPISDRVVITAGLTSFLIESDAHKNPDGTAIDLTGYTLAGEIRDSQDSDGTLLGTIDTTDSDLPNGVIVALIDPATSTAVEAGAVALGPDGVTREAYADINVTDTLGRTFCWYVFVLPVRKSCTEITI